MSAVPQWLMPHTVTVSVWEGDGSHGPVWSDGVETRALVAERVRQVRSAEGTVTVSTATVYAPVGLHCPPGSRVTLPSGRTTRVLTSAQHTAPGLPLPECTEVICE